MREEFNASLKRFIDGKVKESCKWETHLVYTPRIYIEESDGMICFANPDSAFILNIDGEGIANGEELEPMERLAHAYAVSLGLFE